MECISRAMAQVDRCRPLDAETQVRVWASPHGISGGKSGIGTGFSQTVLFSNYEYHSTMSLHTQMSSGEMNNRFTGGCSSETVSPERYAYSSIFVIYALHKMIN
jgi:hypothetical protein